MSKTKKNRISLIARFAITAVVSVAILPLCAEAKQLTPNECRAQHMKGGAKHVQALFKCWSKAAKRGTAVDEECLDDVHRKNVKYVWENTGYGCTGSMDGTAAITRRIEDTVAVHLYDETAPLYDRCAADKLKAAGKYGSTVQKLGSKLAKTAGAYAEMYAKKRLRAEVKIAAAFAKAESRGNCYTVGDVTAVRATMDDGLGLYSYCDYETSDGNVRNCLTDIGSAEGFFLDTRGEDSRLNGWTAQLLVKSNDVPISPNTWFGRHYYMMTPAMSSTPAAGSSYLPGADQVYLGFNARHIHETMKVEFVNMAPTAGSDWVVLFEGFEIPLCSSGGASADPCREQPSPGSVVSTVHTSRNGIYQLALPQ